MPTLQELHDRLKVMLQDVSPDGLGRFTKELIAQIQHFLVIEYRRSFPQLQWELRHGETYRWRLRELGVPEEFIGGLGIYVGNRFTGTIVLDLGFTRQRILDGYPSDALINLVGTIIEESMHALDPRVMDKEMVHIRIRLVEKFLSPFKFTQEDKKMLIDSVTEEPNHGFLE